MINICVITPIVTKGFRNSSQLQMAASDECKITTMTLDRGPASVESSIDEVLAGPGVVDAACQAEADGCDVVVIDCMLDPALEAAREALSIPVIGAGEAGMKAAAKFGKFSVVTVLQRQELAFRRLARQYGLIENLVSVQGIGISVLDLESTPEASIKATIRGAQAARTDDGAEAIVFGCTGMLGYAEPTAKALGWSPDHVIDPLMNAIQTALQSVKTGEKTDKVQHPFPERKKVAGFENWVALNDLMTVR